jgi:hypothetical protein
MSDRSLLTTALVAPPLRWPRARILNPESGAGPP